MSATGARRGWPPPLDVMGSISLILVPFQELVAPEDKKSSLRLILMPLRLQRSMSRLFQPLLTRLCTAHGASSKKRNIFIDLGKKMACRVSKSCGSIYLGLTPSGSYIAVSYLASDLTF
jgi:hypothetical protein